MLKKLHVPGLGFPGPTGRTAEDAGSPDADPGPALIGRVPVRQRAVQRGVVGKGEECVHALTLSDSHGRAAGDRARHPGGCACHPVLIAASTRAEWPSWEFPDHFSGRSEAECLGGPADNSVMSLLQFQRV